jgi:hypothetical protein
MIAASCGAIGFAASTVVVRRVKTDEHLLIKCAPSPLGFCVDIPLNQTCAVLFT